MSLPSSVYWMSCTSLPCVLCDERMLLRNWAHQAHEFLSDFRELGWQVGRSHRRLRDCGLKRTTAHASIKFSRSCQKIHASMTCMLMGYTNTIAAPIVSSLMRLLSLMAIRAATVAACRSKLLLLSITTQEQTPDLWKQSELWQYSEL